MASDSVSQTETYKKISDSEGQDQTARMCSLILLYTLCKMNPWTRTAGWSGEGRVNICLKIVVLLPENVPDFPVKKLWRARVPMCHKTI